MVQEFSPLKSHTNYLSEALGPALGQGLGNFMGNYMAQKSLQKVMQDPSLKNAPMSEKMSRLQQAMLSHGPRGQQVFQNMMQIEKQRMMEENQKEMSLKGKKQAESMKQALIKANVPPEAADQFADVYESATEGGKTELLKSFNDMLRRGKMGLYSENEKNKIASDNQIDEWPEFEEPEGLIPSENVKLRTSREKHNLPIYEKTIATLSGLENEQRDIERLQQLESRDNLPTGLSKWDINWETGEPRFSVGTLHPDAQLYIKTIANMLGKAKEFFPGRVTNFDLHTFKQRFPTLANSKEGRILIQKQLELANKIAYLKDDIYKQAIEHYGADADPTKIRKIANEKYKDQKKILEERLKNLDGLLDAEYEKNKNQTPDQVERPGFIKMKDPQGIERWIPENMINQIQGIQ